MANSNTYYTRGYPKNVIAKNGKKVDIKYLCNVCELVLRDPVQASCGHRYCKLCLEEALRAGGPVTCKECEKEGPDTEATEDFSIISQDQIYPDKAFQREMGKLHVKCANTGCKWKGRFQQFEDHFRECEFMIVKCQNCGESVKKSCLQSHMTTKCRTACTACNEMVPVDKMKEHKDDSCPKALMMCIDCGRSGVVRENLESHQQSPECRKEPIRCPFGCGMIQRRKYQDHFNMQHHAISVVNTLENIEKKVQEFTPGLDEFRTQILAQVTSADKRVTVLERKINDFGTQVTAQTHSSQLQRLPNIEANIRQVVESQLHQVNGRVDTASDTFESLSSALHRMLEKTITGVEKLEGHQQNMASLLERNSDKIQALERKMEGKRSILDALTINVQSLELASYDGQLLWRLDNFSKTYQDAREGRVLSIYSPPFFSSRQGYKMCVKLHPNGDGMGKNTHLSLFFVVMKGNYDPLLKWPFVHRVTFALINQNGGDHVVDFFSPDPRSSSFKQPTNEMNLASGCPLFAQQSLVLNPQLGFLKEDAVFIKISIETDIPDRLL